MVQGPTSGYCCCGNTTGADALAERLGKMQLDWLSTDEYYDVSIEAYEAWSTYMQPATRLIANQSRRSTLHA